MSDWKNPGEQDDLFDDLDAAEAVTSADDDTVASEVSTTTDDANLDAGRDVGELPRGSTRTNRERTVDEEQRREEQRERMRAELDKPVETICPQVHELGAHLLFTEEDHTLADDDVRDFDDADVVDRHNRTAMIPFFAIVRQYEPDLPDVIEPFGFDGNAWRLRPDDVKGGTRYWEGKIAARGEDYDAFNEYQIGLVAGDATGERKVTFQFRPSLPCATHVETGNQIGKMPRDLPYGVRVQVHASNVHPDKIVPLLQRLCKEIGINPGYFGPERVHPHSRVYQLAEYVRPGREYGERHLVCRGALLDRLADFGKNSGGRGEYKWDNGEVLGHRNAVTLDDASWSKLLPDMQVGARAKYYHPQLVRSDDTSPDEDSLRDPKYELQFTPKYSEENSVPWYDADGYDKDDLLDDLDMALVNTLEWSGMPTSTDQPYTPDEYFDASTDDRDVPIYENPMDDLREQEEDVAFKNFTRGDATEGEREVLLATADGGDGQHWSDLVSKSGTSRSTVYRAVETYGDIIEAVNGEISFRDGVMRGRVEELFSTFNDAAEWVRGQLRNVTEREQRDLADTALGRWMRQHMATVTESADGMLVKVDSGRPLDRLELTKVLRQGYEAARTEGFQTALEFVENSTVVWTDYEGNNHESSGVIRSSNAWVSVNGQHVAPLR